jgi:small subunit ribosomal protein S6
MSNFLKYDVIYILDPNSTPEEMLAVATKVEQITADAKGTLLKKDDWGKRRLAYMVQKHRDGHYVFYHLSITPDTVAEITRNLRLLEKVIKFSVVKDTISHLKAKVKPPRVKAPGAPTQGQVNRGGYNNRGSYRPSSSSHSSAPSTTSVTNPAPAAAPAPAPAPVSPAPETPSTTTV